MSSLLDKSNMEIQIPRSYRGPITIHVASGNLDEHIVFSREVKERSVVLREGRFARGCFVGRQEFEGVEEEEVEGEEECEVGDGDKKGAGVCEVCRGSKGGNGVEERKVVSPMLATANNGKAMTDLQPSSGDGSSEAATPLRMVKRKPIKPFSMQDLERDSNSSLKEGSTSPPLPPQSPPPPQLSSPPLPTVPEDTTPPTSENSSPSPPPSITTPNDILTNRPSFLDTDPNVSSSSSNQIDPNNNILSGWKLSRNQDLNGRARRAGLTEQHVAPYRSSPLRFSMTSASAPNLPLVRRESGGQGLGERVVQFEELTSLPSSSDEDERGEEGEEEEEEENDGAGTGSGSVGYESAEDGSGSGSGLEELSTTTTLENNQEQEQEQQQQQPQQPQQQSQQQPQQLQQPQEPLRCTCDHQLQKRVSQRQGKSTIRKRREWIGDRIDIMIGKGRVKIKYDDEVEADVRRSGKWFGR
jgi:hypothetical protein